MTDADMVAYRRLRAKGLRPARIDGCAALEATATRDSLSWGRGMTDDQMQRAREGMAKAIELFG